ncbi:photosystem reaction center subunit H [Hyphomicrobium methylovorum]|nr:photosystem reaction center subunit H [Hyphomicrobium methylovorum]
MHLKVLMATVAFPVIATAGYAQTTTTTPSANPPAATTQTTPPSTVAAPQWYQSQPGELRSSKLVGSKVTNNADENIGEINEIVLASDGSAAAAIIGVGGFLGMGEHQVAVAFKSLKISRDERGNDVVKLDATKESLKAAPQWSWKSA